MRLVQLVTLLAISPAVAMAQVAADSLTDSTRVQLTTVRVTAARSTAVAGGASAVVVRTDELRSSPAPLLDEALRESPFVLVRENSRGQAEISVRGSDSRQVAVMLDGLPLTLGWDHRTDPSLIPITGSSTITVVRGLGSLLSGPNAIGGVIEVRHDAPTTNDAWIGGSVDGSGALVTTVGGAGVLAPSLSIEGGLGVRDRAGVPLPGSAPDPTAHDGLRTNSDLHHADGFAALRWRGALGRSLGLTVTAFNAERGVPPEELEPSPRLWRYPYDSRYVVGLSAASGIIATPFGTASVDASVGVNAGAMRIDMYTDRTYTTVNESEEGNERDVTGRVHATHTLGAGTLGAAFTTSTIDYRESTSGGIANFQQKLWSAATELQWPVGGGTSLAAGVALDHSSTPRTGGRTPGQPPIDAMGWRVGASRVLSPSLLLHASASQRSRFPALRELYSGAANRFQPNPGLKPETLLGFEGGLTWHVTTPADGRAVFGFTAFRHDLRDAVVRTTVPNPSPPPTSLFRRVNRDHIESFGMEMLGSYTFGPGARAISLSGDALVQQITIRDQMAGLGAHHAENNPEQRGTLELGVPMPLALRGTINARYTGTQYCLNGSTGTEGALPARVESDVAFERWFTLKSGLFQSLRALVSVDNVADVAVYDQCGLVQPGRTFRLGFMLR
jgi:iron complex outermembrane receptor protein